MGPRIIVPCLIAAIGGGLLCAQGVRAQTDSVNESIEAPSQYVEEVEGPDAGPGVASEVDSAQAQAAVAAGSGKQVAKKVEEIVVFARKRAELLENTPLSVTALSEETLRVTNTTRLDQIQNLVPNLSMFRGISGETLSVNVRGVGNFPTIYFDQGVGLYVDGVFLSRNQGSVLDIVDVEQVEVLRGPQGTLFGKNTLGGAINITTIKPRNELEAFVLLRTGSYGQIDTRATLNVPVIDDLLALRATFASFKNSGYVYNETRDEYLSNRNSMNFLGSLRFTPIQSLTIDVTGNWSKAQSRPNGGKCSYIAPQNITDGFAAVIDSIRGTVENAGGTFPDDYRDSCNASTAFRVRNDAYQLAISENVGAWGNLTWDVGDAAFVQDLAITLRSSWREQYPANRLDGDGAPFLWPWRATSGTGPTSRCSRGPMRARPSISAVAPASSVRFSRRYRSTGRPGTAASTLWAVSSHSGRRRRRIRVSSPTQTASWEARRSDWCPLSGRRRPTTGIGRSTPRGRRTSPTG